MTSSAGQQWRHEASQSGNNINSISFLQQRCSEDARTLTRTTLCPCVWMSGCRLCIGSKQTETVLDGREQRPHCTCFLHDLISQGYVSRSDAEHNGLNIYIHIRAVDMMQRMCSVNQMYVSTCFRRTHLDETRVDDEENSIEHHGIVRLKDACHLNGVCYSNGRFLFSWASHVGSG